MGLNFKEIRQITHLTQRGFSNYFGIPLGTIRNWEQGVSEPPEYVFNMIFASLRRDKMINVETIKFINLLNDLATLGAEGIKSFSDATRETIYDLLYYDNESPDEDGHFPIVRDSCVVDDPDYYHHDIISYYDSDSEEYTIRVVFDDDGIPFIQVKLILSDEEIIIEHGRWYFT